MEKTKEFRNEMLKWCYERGAHLMKEKQDIWKKLINAEDEEVERLSTTYFQMSARISEIRNIIRFIKGY